MKKYILILLTIALIFLVEIKAESPSGDGEDSGDGKTGNETGNTTGKETGTDKKNDDKNDDKTETDPELNGPQGTNLSTWKNDEADFSKPLDIPKKGEKGDPTGNGRNLKDPEGTKMHLSVLEGFGSGFHFNFFGKKYYKAVRFVFVIIIRVGRLRSRLLMRNLQSETNTESCETNEALLLGKILENIKNQPKHSLDDAKQKLLDSRESMLYCKGTGSGSMGINWDKIPDGASPDEALKKDDDISDNTQSEYLDTIAKGIAEDVRYIHIFGIQDPDRASKTFTVNSYYATTIMGGNSVVDKEIKENLGGVTCTFKNIDTTGTTMECDQEVTVDALKKSANITGSGDKEQIFLNFVKSESVSNPSNKQYSDKSGSGLSTGGIVAIVIVCVVIVVAIAVISFMLSKKPSIPEENDITNEIDSQAKAAPVQ